MEFSEFEAVVNDAFDVSTVNLELKSGGEVTKKSLTAKNPSGSVSTQSSEFRTKYVLNMLGALVCLGAAGFILWRLCRKPKLLSGHKGTSEKTGEGPTLGSPRSDPS